jgi:hypothetical protein
MRRIINYFLSSGRPTGSPIEEALRKFKAIMAGGV